VHHLVNNAAYFDWKGTCIEEYLWFRQWKIQDFQKEFSWSRNGLFASQWLEYTDRIFQFNFHCSSGSFRHVNVHTSVSGKSRHEKPRFAGMLYRSH
jgi:hypothetical protein